MIYQKEAALQSGVDVILELAPVDPRSLMQGDYMQLRYRLASKILSEAQDKGLAYVTLDSRGVALDIDLVKGGDKVALRYQKNYQVSFGVENYFFQEGQAEVFEKARYGKLKVAKDGTPILVCLLDENLNVIAP